MGANVLETFKIVFETTAKQASNDIESLENQLEDIAEAGLDTEEAIGGVGDGLDKMKGHLMGIVAALAAVGLSVDGILDAQRVAFDYGNQAKMLGANVSQLYAYGEAAERAGGSVSGFMGSMKSLQDQMLEYDQTGNGSIGEIAARIGINPWLGKGGVMAELPQLANVFSRMSMPKAQFWGQKLGLDEGTIMLLHKGGAAVQALAAKYAKFGVETEAEYKQAQKFHIALGNIEQEVETTGMKLGFILLPAIQALSKGTKEFVDFCANHKDLVESIFIGIGSVIATYCVTALGSMVAESVAAFAPIYALIGVVAALGFAWHEIDGYMHGQKNMLSKLVAQYPQLKQPMNEIVKLWQHFNPEMKSASEMMFHQFESILGIIFKVFKLGINLIYDAIEQPNKLISDLEKNIKSIFGSIEKFATGGVFGKLMGLFGKADAFIKGEVSGKDGKDATATGKTSLLGDVGHYSKEALDNNPVTALSEGIASLFEEFFSSGGAQTLQSASANPMNNATSSQIAASTTSTSTSSSAKTVTVNSAIHVHGAQDPNAIAKAVDDRLSQHIAQANEQNDSVIVA